MNKPLLRVLSCSCTPLHRSFATTSLFNREYKLVVLGGGSGGCSIAAKFARKLDPSSIAVIDPADIHYYQPLWTLVGGGMNSLEESSKPMSAVLPKNVNWIKESVTEIHPDKNTVHVSNHKEPIKYQYLVVALGIQLKYSQIKGLPEAFHTPGVCSNYSPLYVQKTYDCIKNFKSGNAIFTFPNTPIKCAGAPQKIMYIADSYWRKHGKRQDANIIFNSSLGVLFGVKKYADALWKVVDERDIKVNLKRNLIEINSRDKKAVFEDLDNQGKTESFDYEMIHVTPPMGPIDVQHHKSGDLVDAAGYVNLNKATLQHVKYPNVFGIGDCTNLPTSKTAAAVAGQCGVVESNLWSVMNGKELLEKRYNGYTSCPLVTSYSTCILAEFDYQPQPLETFPINQGKEWRWAFYMKKHMIPFIYWNFMLKGNWNGPGVFRKITHLGLK